MCISIRGATTVDENTSEAILGATTILLKTIIEKNGLTKDEIIQIIFTATKDLDAVYPARAARELGLTEVGLMCMQEMYVEGSLPMCIRLMMLCNKPIKKTDINHVYQNKAEQLRPDWQKNKSN